MNKFEKSYAKKPEADLLKKSRAAKFIFILLLIILSMHSKNSFGQENQKTNINDKTSTCNKIGELSALIDDIFKMAGTNAFIKYQSLVKDAVNENWLSMGGLRFDKYDHRVKEIENYIKTESTLFSHLPPSQKMIDAEIRYKGIRAYLNEIFQNAKKKGKSTEEITKEIIDECPNSTLAFIKQDLYQWIF
jgi:hypothetical protein